MSEPLSEQKPIEFTGMKAFIKDMIDGESDIMRLKEITMYMIGAQRETLEVQQLHKMILDYDSRFDRIERYVKYQTAAIIAIATATGANVLEFVIKMLGG